MANDSDILAVRLNLLHEDVGEIKTALGKLSDAITKLALVEQNQLQTAEAMERAFTAIERIERRVEKLEHSGWESSHSAKWVDRAIVAAITVGGMALLRAVGIG
jgi:Mg2+ and Co2+ transporter CorA